MTDITSPILDAILAELKAIREESHGRTEVLEAVSAKIADLREDLKRREQRRRDEAGLPTRRAAPSTGATSAGGAVFPNYGRAKGEPVEGASLSNLDYYASGCRKTLADPGKARWHDKERVLLAAIEAEIARQSGSPPPTTAADFSDGAKPDPDDDIPF